MQAYYEEELIPSKIKKNYYEIKFYGDNFNCDFSDRKYNEFLSYELKELTIIKNRIKISSSEGIIISGGEPLLQRQALLNIFNLCKKNKIKTGIITNASKPEVLESLLKLGILDTIIIDMKTGEEDFKRITKAGTFFKSSKDIYSDIISSLKILKKYDQEVEIIFRTTIIPGYVYRKEVIVEIAKLIKDLACTFELNKFTPKQDSLFKNIIPPSDKFMKNLKDILVKEYPKLNVVIELI